MSPSRKKGTSSLSPGMGETERGRTAAATKEAADAPEQ